MTRRDLTPAWTRRQVLAGGVGLAAAVATGGGLFRALEQFGREDLIPGEAVPVQLEPEQWQTTADRVSFAAIGDCGSGGRKAMAVAEQLALSYREQPFGHVSLLGDICYYGPISERFDEVFVKPFSPLINAGVQFELAIGNHEGDIFFDDSVPDVAATLRLLGTPGRYYSTVHGPAEFFNLDSSNLGLLGLDGESQVEWLDDALASSTSRWKIVSLHHPLYSSGVHGSTEELQTLLEPTLVRHQVDLVLAGHDHHYERSVPINGITHIVSGGGCKLTPVDASLHTAFARSTLEFLKVDIEGDRLSGRAIDVDGGVLDSFELRAKEER